MTNLDNIKNSAEVLNKMRDLLAAIVREATHRGADEIVDLAGRADELATNLLQQEVH